MIAVLTGDVVNSKQINSQDWLKVMKSTLAQYGDSPQQWEVYRGDSFQLYVPIENVLIVAFHLKSVVKQIKNLDLRIGIGIGEVKYKADRILESNGSAFVRSGECFENLKKQHIMIRSSQKELDEAVNIMLSLALFISDKWSTTVAKIITLAIENPNLNQNQLADKLQTSQSNISEALKRGGFDDIKGINAYLNKQISRLC